MFKDASDYLNKNPKVAAGVAGAAVLIALLVCYFMFFSGGSSTTATGPQGVQGAPTQQPYARTASMGPASSGPQGPSTGDSDMVTKFKNMPAGKADPFVPFWKRHLLVTTTIYHTVLINPLTGKPYDEHPVFTPPTPPVFYTASTSGVPDENGGLTGSINVPTAAGPEPPQRMAGIIYNTDRVVAVLEKANGFGENAQSYVVQPGSPIGNDSHVVAISPDSITIEHKDGKREELPLKAGTLKNLPPAKYFSSGMGNGVVNPYGAGMPGTAPGYGSSAYGSGAYPGYRGAPPGGSSAYPGYGQPGYGAPNRGSGTPGYGQPGYGTPNRGSGTSGYGTPYRAGLQ